MRTLLAFILPLSLSAQTYVAEWQFLPSPCFYMLPACADSPTQDCGYAYSNTQVMVGSNLGWNGVLVCSRAHDEEDGFLLTKGWTQGYTSQHFITVAASVSEPVHIEEIQIGYRTTWGGPMKMKVDWEPSTQVGTPSIDLGDFDIPDTSLQVLTFTNLGDVEIHEDGSPGGLFLMLRAHQMIDSSTLYLEYVRIVATPRITTGTREQVWIQGKKDGRRFLVDGRIW